MFNRRFLPCLAWGPGPGRHSAAAPGRLTPTGPFGTLDSGVEELVFPGADPRQLLIRTPFDLFLSRDAGFAWRSVLSNFPQIRPAALALDGTEGGRWYVTDAAGPGSRVWWSADQGASWSALPLPALPAGQRRLSFFADRFQPSNLALEVFFPEAGTYHRYASTSRGQAWTELAPAGLDGEQQEMLGLGGGSLYFRTLRYELASGAASPIGFEAVSRLFFDLTRPATLYAAVDGGPYGTLFSSTNRGATLVRLREYGVRVRFLAQSPANSSHLAIGDADGLVLSLDRGNTWTPGAVLPAATARQAAFDPASGELLLAGKALIRRHLDGSLGAPAALHGLRACDDRGDRHRPGSGNGIRLGPLRPRFPARPAGVLAAPGPARRGGPIRLPRRAAAGALAGPARFRPGGCENSGLYASSDFGWTWTHSQLPTTVTHWGTFDLAASGSSYFLLANGQILRSPDGTTWQDPFRQHRQRLGFRRPSRTRPRRGRGQFDRRHQPPRAGWRPRGQHLPAARWRRRTGRSSFEGLPVHDDRPRPRPWRPDLRGARLDPRRAAWTPARPGTSGPTSGRSSPSAWDEDLPITEALIDPFDGAHLLLLDRGLESRDGGPHLLRLGKRFRPAAFGREIADHFLQARAGDGVVEHTGTCRHAQARRDQPGRHRRANASSSVFVQLARGLSVAQIADNLSSPSTVGTHLYHVKQKLGASNQSELTLVALNWGLIQDGVERPSPSARRSWGPSASMPSWICSAQVAVWVATDQRCRRGFRAGRSGRPRRPR